MNGAIQLKIKDAVTKREDELLAKERDTTRAAAEEELKEEAVAISTWLEERDSRKRVRRRRRLSQTTHTSYAPSRTLHDVSIVVALLGASRAASCGAGRLGDSA